MTNRTSYDTYFLQLTNESLCTGAFGDFARYSKPQFVQVIPNGCKHYVADFLTPNSELYILNFAICDRADVWVMHSKRSPIWQESLYLGCSTLSLDCETSAQMRTNEWVYLRCTLLVPSSLPEPEGSHADDDREQQIFSPEPDRQSDDRPNQPRILPAEPKAIILHHNGGHHNRC